MRRTLTSDEMPGVEGVGECATLPDLSCDAKPEYEMTLRQVCQMVEQMGGGLAAERTKLLQLAEKIVTENYKLLVTK